jgi:hypothetical protein
MSKSKELFMQVREAEMNTWDARDADYFYHQYQIQTAEPNK